MSDSQRDSSLSSAPATESANSAAPEAQAAAGTADSVEPLIALAAALLDFDRLRVAGALADAPANRMQLQADTGISQRDLLRHLDNLQQAGIVRPQENKRQLDPYTPYELNAETFSLARKAMGKYRGVKPRPTDAREMVLETFMPGGKLVSIPKKQEQIVTILDVLAGKFEPEKPYAEREVNVILEEANEDYCTLRRYLVDYGYLDRKDGVYLKRET